MIAPTASIPGGTTPQPTPTTSLFLTPTLTPTFRASGNFSQSSLKPGPLVNGPLIGFADPAFERVWQRNDRPIAEQRANRSWTWGPHGLMARTEGYIQSASGLRQVQYFDKGRMEVNDPRGDRNSQWFVTTGLLVIELISGRTQIGDSQFVQHSPANIPIAGDQSDPNAPTYASFGGVSGQQPGDRSGQLVGETLSRSGPSRRLRRPAAARGAAGALRPRKRPQHSASLLGLSERQRHDLRGPALRQWHAGELGLHTRLPDQRAVLDPHQSRRG